MGIAFVCKKTLPPPQTIYSHFMNDARIQIYAQDSYKTVTCVYSPNNSYDFFARSYYGYIGLRTRCGSVFQGTCTELQNYEFMFQNVLATDPVLYAQVRLTSSTTIPSGGGGYVNIYMNDEDNAVHPTTYSGYDALALTTNYNAYEFNNVANQDGLTYVIDVKDMLNEVIARPGWVPGNSVMVIMKRTGTSGIYGPTLRYNSLNPLQYELTYGYE